MFLQLPILQGRRSHRLKLGGAENLKHYCLTIMPRDDDARSKEALLSESECGALPDVSAADYRAGYANCSVIFKNRNR